MARRPDLHGRRALALALPVGTLLGTVLGSRERLQEGAKSEPTVAAPYTGPVPSPSTVLLLRHAEKDPAGDPGDPGLSSAGKARAEALSRLLRRARIARLYSSEFRRTRETLEPLAKALSLEVEVVAASARADLLARIDALPPGSTCVIAGHSNTIPGLVAALGGEVGRIAGLKGTEQGPVIPDEEFDRLLVVMRGPEAANAGERLVSVLDLAYGV